MRITERYLRSIIRNVIFEEKKRINENAQFEQLKQSLKAAALSAGVVLSASEIVNITSNMLQSKSATEDIKQDANYKGSKTEDIKQDANYKGMSGDVLIKFIIENDDEIPDEDLNKVANALRFYPLYGNITVKTRYGSAMEIIRNRLKNSGHFYDYEMFNQ